MGDALLGIDLGTTAVKVAAFAADTGELLGLSTREYPLDTPHEQWAELDAEVYWRSIVDGVEELRALLPTWRMAAVGLSSQGQTFVLLDAEGKPLRKAIVWLDTRAGEECAALLAGLGAEAWRAQTGLDFPQPIASVSKLMWVKRHEPAVWSRVRHIAMLPSYIAYRLTGRLACDPCNLASTGLFGEAGWWLEALEVAGLSRELFDDVVDTGVRIGQTSEAAARQLGLEAGIAVGAGSNDQLTGAIGVANVRPGLISGAVGTAMALVGTLPGEAISRAAVLPSHPHPVTGLRYGMPFAMTTGILLRWYRDRFGNGLSYDELIGLAAQAPPGADGVTLLPHFSGTGTPNFRADVRGALLGLSLSHGPPHIVRAILEAVGFTVRDAIELFRRDYATPPRSLRVLGGASRSPLWMQLLADIGELPVELPRCSEAAVLGAAICGGVAGGLLPDLVTAAEGFYQVRRTFVPGAQRAFYDAPYRRYRDAMQALYPGAL